MWLSERTNNRQGKKQLLYVWAVINLVIDTTGKTSKQQALRNNLIILFDLDLVYI